jgi:hypothetical protein
MALTMLATIHATSSSKMAPMTFGRKFTMVVNISRNAPDNWFINILLSSYGISMRYYLNIPMWLS